MELMSFRATYIQQSLYRVNGLMYIHMYVHICIVHTYMYAHIVHLCTYVLELMSFSLNRATYIQQSLYRVNGLKHTYVCRCVGP
jgi:hypothetical protein